MTEILGTDLYTFVARILVLVTAMPVHERAHGWAAYKLGDNTAYLMGRLTYNPAAHLDLWGSLLLLFTGFGWAKPVRINPRNFKKPRRDMALTALAGPASNILLALLMTVLFKLTLGFAPAFRNVASLELAANILSTMILVNLTLAVFNLLPVPPLDGSRIFGAFLPVKFYNFVSRYENVIAIALIVLVVTGALSIPIRWLSGLLLMLLDTITLPINWLLF